VLNIRVLFPDELALKALRTTARIKPTDIVDVWCCEPGRAGCAPAGSDRGSGVWRPGGGVADGGGAAARPAPPGAVQTDLGEHRLRDLGRPERISPLRAAGRPAEFPPLRSLGNPALLNNLPVQPTAFIGRTA